MSSIGTSGSTSGRFTEASGDMGDARAGVLNVWRAGPITLGVTNPPVRCGVALGGKKIALRGGGLNGDPFAQPPPPPPWSPCPEGVWGGAALPAVPGGGGGGPTPTYMAQNDPHVVLIILTIHMWGKIFS